MKTASSHPTKGFTLVELLVAIAISAVLLTALGIITSNTQSAVKYHKGNMNTDATAWEVFNVIEQDLKNRVEMNSVQFYLGEGTSPDDSLAFYTNRYGIKSTGGNDRVTVGDRKASWVHYELKGRNLQRGSLGLDLTPEDFVSVLPVKNVNSAESFQQIDDRYYQTISDKILRIEIVAVEKETRNQTEEQPRFRYVSTPGENEEQQALTRTVKGIAITLVTLDDQFLKLAQSPEILRTIKALFPEAKPSSEETLSGRWSEIASDVSALPESIPLPIRQNMQVFERVIWF